MSSSKASEAPPSPAEEAPPAEQALSESSRQLGLRGIPRTLIH